MAKTTEGLPPMPVDTLTMEQTQHLIGLGVPEDKATIFRMGCLARTVGFRDCYFFTLANLFPMMPHHIHKDGYDYYLMLTATDDGEWEASYYSWILEIPAADIECHGKTRAEAIYQLMVWCLENKHLSFDKKGNAVH